MDKAETAVKSFLRVVNFEAAKLPEFKEVKNQDWVNFGEKNDYPDYLYTLFNTSSTHSAIVSGKSEYVYGKGFEAQAEGDLQGQDSGDAFINMQNRDGETVNDVAKKAVADFETYNGFYVQVIYGKASGMIAELYHLPFHTMRSSADGLTLYYSKNWSLPKNKQIEGNEETNFQAFPAFDPNKPGGTQVLYAKGYRTKVDVYPLPDYIASLKWIEIDAEIANFHHSNIKNGFFASSMISFFNGVPNEEEQDKIEKQIKKKFTGSDPAGSFLINFAHSKESGGIEIQPIQQADLDKMFEILNKTSQQGVFTGHKVTSPMLFGVKTEGQLGGRSELREAYELFQNTYVNGRQQSIEREFNRLGAVNNVPDVLRLQRNEPISEQIDPAIVVANMTQDEIREKAGLPPIDRQTLDPKEEALNRLNTMSPLLATKVLESMTPEEIRALAGLPPVAASALPAPAPTPAPQFSKFSSEDDTAASSVFSRYGRPADRFTVLRTKNIFFGSEKEVFKSEVAFALDVSANTLEAKVLGILKKNPKARPEDIAGVLKVDSEKILSAIEALAGENYITWEKGEAKLSPEANKVLEVEQPETTVIEIVYKYEVKPGLGPDVIPTTREFCKDMIALDRMYTRREVEAISRELGYSVWAQRGGYYHNPSTGVTTPYCRHIWTQNVVKRKSE